jgi:hypothetical protein
MTTFTMQDLQNAVPTTHQQDEEFKQMENIGLKEVLFDYENAPQVPRETKEVMQAIVANMAIPNPDAIQYTHGGTLGAPEPQPSGENPHNPDISEIINAISKQLELLATVIQAKAQPNTTPPEGNQSLQECVSLTLQQADWFKEMVRGIIDDTYDFADYAENAVEHVVEKEVEHYFDSSFNPEDHFDFGDAVSDAVDDRIDDIVSDKIDDAVDSYLSNATISISK